MNIRASIQEHTNRVIRLLWGDMTHEELRKFWVLSAAFFLLIGAYWFVRVMKDPVFSSLVGYKYQPFAKLLSLVVTVGAVLIYNKLVDVFKRNVLFYILSLFFGIGFLILGYALAHPPLCAIEASSLVGNVACLPGKALGWFIYCFIESFGSIMPALFLAIVASTMTAESAKKGYGMMYSFAQLGLIIGTWLVAQFVGPVGFSILFALGGVCICLLPLFMKRYMAVCAQMPTQQPTTSGKEAPKTGMFEGLRLLVKNPYIAGLLVVTTMYEIISTIVEFQMGMCATQVYPVELDGGAGFAWLKAINGTFVGVLSLLFAVVGTSFLMRRFGLKFCLVSYPALIGVIVALLFLLYVIGASIYVLMWACFGAVVIFKGLSYTLNVPAKEVMYIPTSKDVKFKAKSWIDGFGGRAAKGAGATMTGSLGGNFSLLMIFGTIAALGIVAFWIFVAAYVGNKFNELQRDNKIIE